VAAMSNASSYVSSLVPPFWLSGGTASVSSATYTGVPGAPTVQILQDEYDKLRHLKFS